MNSRRHPIAPALLAVLLTSSSALAAPSELPPEARAHNDAGVAHVGENRLEEAITELQAAYDAMPDPLVHRAGRGKVVGSLRGVLNDLHTATGDPEHLCRLRVLLAAHLAALERALGPSAQAADVQGIRADIYDNNLALARMAHTCRPAQPVEVTPPPVAPVAATPATVSSRPVPADEVPRQVPGRRLQIAGSVLTGTGLASLALMAYAVVIVADTRGSIQTLTHAIRNDDRPPTLAETNTEAALYDRGSSHRALAITAGALGGVAVVTGLALLARHRRHRLARLTPVVAPQFTGASLLLRF